MKIGIIDAEIIGKNKHRFPNLVCMKISSYYKSKGDDVELLLSYDNVSEYDKVYVSKVFIKTEIPYEPKDKSLKKENTIVEYYKDNKFLNLPNVEFGGTGFYYEKAPKLPEEIEHCKPDYHLYDKWVEECIASGAKEKEFAYYRDYSIGFLTRGCFRQCEFCVNKIYKKCNNHSPLSEFMEEDRRKLCFLDDNFFACSNWKEIIDEVKATGKRFQFKQGLDERLLTEEKVKEIKTWKYDGDLIFAFDNIEDKDIIVKKLEILRQYYNNPNVKFYLFCGYDRNDKYDETFWKRDIANLFERIFILAKYNCKPYIMRHENYKNSLYKGMYINIAFWGNQPSLFFNHSFRQICKKDDNRRGAKKTSSTWRYLEQFEKECPDIAKQYFDTVPKSLFLEQDKF